MWSDSTPAFRVELSLPYQSDVVEGTALLHATTSHALRRDATVKGVSGAAPLRVGTRCKLRVTPRPTGRECQTSAAAFPAGSNIVYGKGTMGVASCTMTDGAIHSDHRQQPHQQRRRSGDRRRRRRRDDGARGRDRRITLGGDLRPRSLSLAVRV